MIWGLSALPVLLLVLITDLIWLSQGISIGLKRKGWGRLGLTLLVGVCWAVIVAVDFANH